jgi:hypothetical protein
MQLEAKESIKRWFIDHPDWAILRIPPILLDGKKASAFFIGRKGAIHRRRTNKETSASVVNFIDWVETRQKIRDIYYDEQSNSIDEIGSMHLEDRAARDIENREIDAFNQSQELEEMAGEDRDSRLLRGPANAGWKRSMPIHDPRDLKQQGYETILIDKRTQSSHDQIDSLAKLMVLIRAYRDVIKPMIIRPMMRDGFHFEKNNSNSDYSIRFDKDEAKLIVVANETNKTAPAVREGVDWRDTLDAFIADGESKGVDFTHWKDKTLTARADRFKASPFGNKEAREGTQTGMDFTKVDTSSMSNNVGKEIISDYFKHLTEYGLDLPFRLNPIVSVGRNGQKIDHERFFATPEGSMYLIIRTTHQGEPKLSKSENRKYLKRVIWSSTLDSLLAGVGELSLILQDPDFDLDGAQQSEIRRTISGFERILREKGVSIREPRPVDEKYGLGIQGKLTGRGLRGAGYANIERKSKYYNLNDIKGTGLASAYIYRPIGSKYIRIPDLDRRELNIVYPSRKKIGPKRDISDQIQRMLKTLVYDGKIDQAMYDSLTHDDKRLFKEILSATHIQHTFKEQLTDPLESLKAEYFKLKGEMDLGNDNPSIRSQLKVVSVDMYRNHLISDVEFKQIIVRI